MAANPNGFDHLRRGEYDIMAAVRDQTGMNYFRRGEPLEILALSELKLLSITGVGR
jgi:hypothetical protein